MTESSEEGLDKEENSTENLERYRKKRAVLSFVIDPGDTIGLILCEALGVEEFHRIVSAEEKLSHEMRRKINARLTSVRQKNIEILNKSIVKWQQKYRLWSDDLYRRHMEDGGFVIVPEERRWPPALNDLGINRPIALWGKGLRTIAPMDKVIAIVGSRQSSSYGQRVTADLSYELAISGYSIVSGGAFGIDACAHRSALAAVGKTSRKSITIAVGAGGVDSYYPKQHSRLYQEIIRNGSYISEAAPGTRATKWRFLQRNRLIAALAAAVCVTEARYRSGALNTAHHAFDLLRHVTTVPGSVLSPHSAGCHQLIRKNMALLVTCAQDIKELVEPLGSRNAEGANFAVGGDVSTPNEDACNLTGKDVPDFSAYGSEERYVLQELRQHASLTINEVVSRTLLEPRQVFEILAGLSARGAIREDGQGYALRQNGKGS